MYSRAPHLPHDASSGIHAVLFHSKSLSRTAEYLRAFMHYVGYVYKRTIIPAPNTRYRYLANLIVCRSLYYTYENHTCSGETICT